MPAITFHFRVKIGKIRHYFDQKMTYFAMSFVRVPSNQRSGYRIPLSKF